jgi:integrase
VPTWIELAMKKENFTAGRIAAFKCADGKQQSIYWDAKTPGLGLRVTKAGAKSYIYETRFNGKTLRVTIGDDRSYSITEAQRAATELKSNTDKAIDPRELKADKLVQHEARLMRDKSMSDSLLVPWDEYIRESSDKIRDPWGQRHINDHVRMSAKGGDKRRRSAGQTQEGLLRPLLILNFKQLTQIVITKWLQDNSQIRPTQTALAYRLFRAFYNWLGEHDVYKDLIVEDLLATKKIKSNIPKVLPRKVSLQREQLAGWFKAVKSLPSQVQQAYLQILLLTGARREELAELQWAKVDFKNRAIEIKDKVDDSRLRTIPLTPYVARLLNDLKAELKIQLTARNYRNKENELLSAYVFPSRGISGYIVSPTHRIYTEALKREGLEHMAAHDLRRSFATMGEEADVADGVIKQIMGHKPKSGDTTEAHYKVRTIGRLRDKHIEIERWILDQADIEQPQTQTVESQSLLTLVK